MDGEVKVPPKYDRVTFDKETAKRFRPSECDFIAFGHPLLDRVVRYCRNRDGGFGGGATLKLISDSSGRGKYGVLFNFTYKFVDAFGKTRSETFSPIFISEDETIDEGIVEVIQVNNERERDWREHLKDKRVEALVKKIDILYNIGFARLRVMRKRKWQA